MGGGPHVLRLRKLPKLFARDKRERKAQRELLTWLRKQRRAFAGGS